MKKRTLIIVLLLVCFCFTQNVFAADAELGEKLVRQLWMDVKGGNIQAIEKYISPAFQSVHQDGTRDMTEEIELLKGLHPSDYILDNFKVTQEGPIIIVTYAITIEETLAGKRLPSRTSMRLSVFLETDDGWKMIAHANLNPME